MKAVPRRRGRHARQACKLP